MTNITKCFQILGLISLLSVPSDSFAHQNDGNKISGVSAIQKIMRVQVPFIENKDQADERVKYYANTSAGTVFVTKEGEIVYSLPDTECVSDMNFSRLCGKRDVFGNAGYASQDPLHLLNRYREPCLLDSASHFLQYHCICCPQAMSCYYSDNDSRVKGLAIKESLVGALTQRLNGVKKAITNINYFKGKDSSKWLTNTPTYEHVSFGEVYKGIELKLRAYNNNVEKLFFISPESKTESIRIELSGATSLQVNEEGVLEAEVAHGVVNFTKPIAYQTIDGKRVCVECKYVICDYNSSVINGSGNTDIDNENGRRFVYGFKVGAYNKTKELIIDPLLGSTYLGGTGNEYVKSITTDSNGNVYVIGLTRSSDFPATIGAYDVSYKENSYDVFVSKFSKDLTILLASTYLGGSANDYGYSITADSGGAVYVSGYTYSSDFPATADAYAISKKGSYDVFVSKLNNDLTSLLASTYLGGSSYDYGCSLAIGTDGKVYITGRTWSSDYPTTTGAYRTCHSGHYDAFVSKFNENLTDLLASTYLGGSDDDYGKSIAIGSGGKIYVTGYTESSDYPTTPGAYRTSQAGYLDAFVSKFNENLTDLLASTYLGGTDDDYGESIAIGSGGKIYVTGYTESSDYPTTPGAYRTSQAGYFDVFVSKLNENLTDLLASTYLGGSGDDYGKTITVGSGGKIYVGGYTESTDYPTIPGAYTTSLVGHDDAFVSKLNENLTKLLSSTYLGGSDNDRCEAIATGSGGKIYVSGYTESSDYPTTTEAYMTFFRGKRDAYISMANGNLSPLPEVTTASATNVSYQSAMLHGTVNANGSTTTVMFQYDTTSNSYSRTSPEQTVNGSSDTPVSTDITGLYSGTTYYYRLAARNNEGTVHGSELSFTTASPAGSGDPPPRVVLSINSTSPSNNSENVAVNTKVYATFSLLINGSTFTADTFKLQDKNDSVSGSVTTDGSTAVFTPVNNLAYDTTYSAVITTAAQAANYAGTSLDSNYTWSFTTSSTQDVVAPLGSLTINNGDIYTNATEVTLGLTATDNEGVIGYYISRNPSVPFASSSGWEYFPSTISYTKNVSYTLPDGDGNKIIYVWYKDNAGNISNYVSGSIVLDMTIPKVTISNPTTGPVYVTTGRNISLSGSASDSTSGLRSVAWSDSIGEKGTATGTINWSVSGVNISGKNDIFTVTATDNAGNSGKDTITIIYNPEADPTPTPAPIPTPTLVPTPTVAQKNTGTIYGYVIDNRGKYVKYAKLKFRGMKTLVRKSITVGRNSFFKLSNLESDTYEIVASKKGYKRRRVKVTLRESEEKEVKIKLKRR